MKRLLLIGLVSAIAGCGGSDNENTSDISSDIGGEWVSHCYEVTDENGSFISYAIDSYTFTSASSTFVRNDVSYTDQSCTELNGQTDDYFGTYEIGGIMNLIDGGEARKITIYMSSDVWPDESQNTKVEMGYVTDGSTINFADDTRVFYEITYTKK